MQTGSIEKWRDPSEQSGNAHLIVQFYIDKVYLEAKTKAAQELFLKTNGKEGEDRPLYEDREFIWIRFPGDQTSDIRREVSENDRIRFAEQYSRFKANAANQMIGTPLDQWPAMTPAKIKMLEYYNIYTVDQMAEAADTAIQKLGMDGNDLRQRARAYLMKSRGLDQEKEALKAQAAAQAEQIAKMQEQIAALAASAPEKRGPGRPAKAAPAVAAA